MKSNDELRKELAELLGRRRLRAGLWNHLIHLGAVARVARGEWPLRRLAAIYVTSEETLYPQRRARQGETSRSIRDLRAEALAEMIASDALLEYSGAADFRERFLGDGLLTLEEVAGWIREQAEKEGSPADGYLSVPMRRGYHYGGHPGSEQSREGFAAWLEREAAWVRESQDCELPGFHGSGRQTLTYLAANMRAHQITIRIDGPLAYLKMISHGRLLMCDAAWTEAEMVTFILTDLRFHVVGMTIKRPLIASLPAAAPITIRVNPRVSPRELAKEYAKVRARCAPERDRAMSDRHVTLAVFMHCCRLPERPWTQLREAWNRDYPEWRYDEAADPEARRFALEARDAWCRVSGQRWFDRRKKRKPLTLDFGDSTPSRGADGEGAADLGPHPAP
jgi:hypothetical protein